MRRSVFRCVYLPNCHMSTTTWATDIRFKYLHGSASLGKRRFAQRKVWFWASLQVTHSAGAGKVKLSRFVLCVGSFHGQNNDHWLRRDAASEPQCCILNVFITCLHLYNQKPRNQKKVPLNLLWGPDCVDSCIVKVKSTLQRLGWRLIDTSVVPHISEGKASVHAAVCSVSEVSTAWDGPSSFDHSVVEGLMTEDVAHCTHCRNSDSNSDRLSEVCSLIFSGRFFIISSCWVLVVVTVSECVELCCFLLLQRALLHPLLLALNMLTFITDPLLPERLDVQPVVDQSHVHLQQHNTDSVETLRFIVIWKVLKSTSNGDATVHRASWRRKCFLQ